VCESIAVESPWHIFEVWHLILSQGVVYGVSGGLLYSPYIIWVSVLSTMRINAILDSLWGFRSCRNGSQKCVCISLVHNKPTLYLTLREASIYRGIFGIRGDGFGRRNLPTYHDFFPGAHWIPLDSAHLECNDVAVRRPFYRGSQTETSCRASFAFKSFTPRRSDIPQIPIIFVNGMDNVEGTIPDTNADLKASTIFIQGLAYFCVSLVSHRTNYDIGSALMPSILSTYRHTLLRWGCPESKALLHCQHSIWLPS
jgi:hypothetical protein